MMFLLAQTNYASGPTLQERVAALGAKRAGLARWPSNGRLVGEIDELIRLAPGALNRGDNLPLRDAVVFVERLPVGQFQADAMVRNSETLSALVDALRPPASPPPPTPRVDGPPVADATTNWGNILLLGGFTIAVWFIVKGKS